MSLRILLVIISAMLLPSCANLNAYTTDGAAATALVRFNSNYQFITAFEHADTSQCPARVQTKRIATTYAIGIGSDGELSPLAMYGTSTKKEPLVRERKVVAGQALLIHASATQLAHAYSRGYYCGLGVSFTPQANEQYEVSFQDLGNRCTANVAKLDLSPAGTLVRTHEPTARIVTAGALLCSK